MYIYIYLYIYIHIYIYTYINIDICFVSNEILSLKPDELLVPSSPGLSGPGDGGTFHAISRCIYGAAQFGMDP